MRKITKITGALLLTTMLYGCGSMPQEQKVEKEEPVKVEEVEKEKEEIVVTETEEAVEEDLIMNADNNEEFARLVTGPVTNDEITAFFDAHMLEEIEFDGIIDYIGLIPGKSSRLSAIISTGDGSGTAFIVRDAGAMDDSIRDFITAGHAEAGTNVRVKATNQGYHDESGLISINLELITER